MNSFIYKCYRRGEVPGRACNLSFVACLLPITTQVRSPALHGVYHYLWSSPGKVVWVTEALALGVSFRVPTDELF